MDKETDICSESPYEKNCIYYAKLTKEGKLLWDSEKPVIFPERSYESAGCEDARIVLFEGVYYIFYCAWDLHRPRTAIAKTKDFITYEKMGVINNFKADKDAFIFPERINNKIAFVHRLVPNIQIDYFDSFEEMLSDKNWIDYENKVEEKTVLRGKYEFEDKKIGGGIPPIKTDKGWLFIYHGVRSEGIYSACAALLDLQNPSLELSRLPYTILSPTMEYEMSGDYNGCIFPQGYFINDGELYISYGAADKITAVAKVTLADLIKELEGFK